MTFVLRMAAIAIAIAAVVDPAIARRTRAPLSVEFRLPPASDPAFAAATELRSRIEREIGSSISIDRGLAPHAVIAIGNVGLEGSHGSRIFAVPLTTARPGTSISTLAVSPRIMMGQAARINATVRGLGLSGRTSTITHEIRGATIERVEHKWTNDDETFSLTWSFAPPVAGVYRSRIRVSTADAGDPSVADALVVARDERVRVLVYEPRPSWPVTFVRRSLEADGLFDVASTARTSRSIRARSDNSPASIGEIDPDRFDAVVVGALDELRDRDLQRLEDFVVSRGGSLLLVPDRQIPAAVRRQFDLPPLEEVLLEKPVSVESAAPTLRASELLLRPPSVSPMQTLATVRHAGATRAAILSLDRGEGRVILSGATDAWRYRASENDGFNLFWRALAADAASTAPPKVEISVDPAIARPGDELMVSVRVRRTAFQREEGGITVPPVAATLASAAGFSDSIRLWPGRRVGTFSAGLRAPARGRYTLSASIEGTSAAVPLLVDDDVVHVADNPDPAIPYAAAATGGVVTADPRELVRALETLDTGEEQTTTRPMRSWWWIVPFTLLLCAEWALRRRSGLR